MEQTLQAAITTQSQSHVVELFSLALEHKNKEEALLEGQGGQGAGANRVGRGTARRSAALRPTICQRAERQASKYQLLSININQYQLQSITINYYQLLSITINHYQLRSTTRRRALQRDWYLIVEQPAPAPHLTHPEGCAALRIVLITVPHVSENLPDGFDLRRLPAAVHQPMKQIQKLTVCCTPCTSDNFQPDASLEELCSVGVHGSTHPAQSRKHHEHVCFTKQWLPP